MLDIKQIMEYLPHRYPFLLVDRVIEVNEKELSIVAIKNVTINESFFQGHFPGDPIMPGVLIIEAMAQVAGLCSLYVNKIDAKGKAIYFMGIDKVKFRNKVVPGDQLRFEVKIIRPGSKVAQYEGKVFVDQKLVAEGILTAMLAENK